MTTPVQRTKSSRQRALVLRILKSVKCHPTAEWIYLQAKNEMPSISLSTVYRNLRILSNQGKILELSFGKGINRFDGDLKEHTHVHCTVCQNLVDSPSIPLSRCVQQIEEKTGYQIQSHRLEFWGICPECRKRIGGMYHEKEYR